MAGVALGDIDLRRFAWQAWHLVTSTFTLRGRRGTYGTGLALGAVVAAALCVAGVALGDIDLRFAWQAWRLATLTFTWWQAWHLRHWAGSGDALGSRCAPLSPRHFAWQA